MSTAVQRTTSIRRNLVVAVTMLLVLASLTLATAPPAAAFGSSEPPPTPSISAGGYISCGVQQDGTVACWGENGMPSNDTANTSPGGAATPPAGVTFREVNAGYATACGVRSDQTLVCWGSSRFDKLVVPSGTFTHVVPGQNYVCALRTDSTIACWGGDDPAIDPAQKVIRDVPTGQFSQVTVGNRHACALRADESGTVVCWGHDTVLSSGVNEGQTNVPPGTYSYVNVSNFTSCALRTDGSPVCWGRNQGGQQSYPAGATFTQLSTGFAHVCGLRPDGTATCWGRNSEGQTIVPPGTYTQVSAGTFHTCAVPTSGPPVRCWGNNQSGRVQPNMSNVAPQLGYAGYPYSFQFSMSTSTNSTLGGLAGISPSPTFSLVDGALPAGLSLSPSGLLSGTPTAAGDYSVKVAATNGLSPPDCVNPSVGTQSLPCTPGDPTSVATATRAFTISVSPDAPPPGTIAGRVTTASDGQPFDGATVTIAHSGGAPAGEVTTDGNGDYAVELLPGTYRVTASGPELQPETKPATVASQETTTVDFALGPLVRPTVVSVWNNHYQTVTDGVFVEWSESISPMLGDPARVARYTIHSDVACTTTAIATGSAPNWMPTRPRIRDVVMSGWENVVHGGSYFLRVAPGTELGTTTNQRNALACVPFLASLSPADDSTVAGRVTSAATGAPVAGATVTVTRTIGAPGTTAGQVTTDAGGNYEVSHLAPGPYTVTATAAGHVSKSNAVTAAGGASTTSDFALAAVPVANDDAFTHYGTDTALVVAASGVLANDTDADGDVLTASIVSGPSRGTATLELDGSFVYRPAEDFVGTDSFTYKVNDGTTDSNVARVTVTVGAGCQGQQATITGTGGRDRITGTPGPDVIAGLGGNDSISGAGGDDLICGGSGKDSIDGGAGNDDLDGGSGDDTVLGGAGDDLLTGGAGAPDMCNGGAGTDSFNLEHGCERTAGVP